MSPKAENRAYYNGFLMIALDQSTVSAYMDPPIVLLAVPIWYSSKKGNQILQKFSVGYSSQRA